MNDLTQVSQQPTDAALDVPPIMVPEKFVAAVFDPFKRKLASAKRAAAKVEAYDITTTAGMNQAKELRASFRDIRTSLENERKTRKAPIIAAGKLLDQRAAELTCEIEPLESKYDREIKAEEQRKEAEKQRKLDEERARVEAIQNRVDNIRNVPARMASADSATIRKEIEQQTLLRLDPADYQEYLEDALTAVNTTLVQLEDLLAEAEKREAAARQAEADRAELARLRAEKEALDKAEREAAAERERKTKMERDEAAAREAEQRRQMEIMRAEQEKQTRIMADIAQLQQAALFDGDARDIDATLERLTSTIIDEPSFGIMTAMARTTRDMAVSSLMAKLQVRADAAHAEALAEKAQRETVAIPLIEEGTPTVLGVALGEPAETRTHNGFILGQPINSTGQYYSRTTFKDNGQPIMCNADGTRSIFCDVDDDDEPGNWMFGMPTLDEVAPVAPTRPDAGEILDVLMRHFSASESVVIGWLRDLVMEQGL